MRCCRALAVLAALVMAGCQRGPRRGQAGPTGTDALPVSRPPVDASVVWAADGVGSEPTAALGAPRPAPTPRAPAPEAAHAVELVTIKLLVEPPKRAHVFWGVKDLGVAPLELRRPRGSGPMDLVLRAPGFLTHHTRVFTDRDDTLFVRLGPETEGARYAGYQAPVEKNAQETRTETRPETRARSGITQGTKPNSKENRGR